MRKNWKEKLNETMYTAIWMACLGTGLFFSYSEKTLGSYFLILGLAVVVEYYYLKHLKNIGVTY
jgi:hypothetical protein